MARHSSLLIKPRPTSRSNAFGTSSYLEALQQIASDADEFVFMPYEASGVMASLSGSRELLQTARPPAK